MGETERHPLFGAELRVDRAKRHIAELNEVLHQWAQAHPDALTLNRQPDGGFNLLERDDSGLPVDLLAEASAVIGDVVYNLRAALDYTVYALAVIGNNGNEVSGTQFPIEDDPDDFAGRVSGRHPVTQKRIAQHLRKVPGPAVEMIRKLQPFAGSKWTKTLQSLSNPDRHRVLTALRSKAEFTFDPRAVSLQGDELAITGDVAVQVFFLGTEEDPEVLDAPDTLEFLERCVRLTIQAFKTFIHERDGG